MVTIQLYFSEQQMTKYLEQLDYVIRQETVESDRYEGMFFEKILVYSHKNQLVGELNTVFERELSQRLLKL